MSVEEVSLKLPIRFWNFVEGDVLPEWQEIVDRFEELKVLHRDGKPIYIRFRTGDYAGSVARFVPEEGTDRFGNPYFRLGCTATRDRSRGSKEGYRYEVDVHGTARWTGRSNKPQVNLASYYDDVVWLRGYEGPTSFVMVDKKAVKAAAVEKKIFLDFEANELKVGDRVLYVNIRYGQGTQLDVGKVVRFEAELRSRGRSETFVVVSREGDGVESKVSSPERMVMKFDPGNMNA